MKKHIVFSVNAVLPLILAILTGYLIRRTGLAKESYFKVSDKLIYYIFMPCSIFCSLYTMDSSSNINMDYMIFMFAGMTALYILGMLSGRLMIEDQSSRGVAVMTVFRTNSAFVGIPLANAVAGNDGVAATVAAMLIAVPALNTFTFLCFSPKKNFSGKSKVPDVVKDFFENPLIISCILGMLVLSVRKFIPVDNTGAPVFSLERDLNPLYCLVSALGSIASALALINIGGLIDFRFDGGADLRNLLFGCVWRTILAPAIIIAAAFALSKLHVINFTAGMFAAILAHFATPAAVSGPMMATQLGGDAKLARCYTVITTVLSALTIPLFILILCILGIF